MTSVTIEEAQSRFSELISSLGPGDEVQIVQGDRAVAKLVGQMDAPRRARSPGSARDRILYMADDFDAPLDDFDGYMPCIVARYPCVSVVRPGRPSSQ